MSETRSLASVVVLNFNGARYLTDCLSSLSAQTYAPLEIVVADNGSSDRSSDIAAAFPVRWLPFGMNLGFARGNNRGAAACAGEILVFVNNDMCFVPEFVERLVLPLLADNSLFATDARQLDWNGRTTLRRAVRLERHSWLANPFRADWVPGLRVAQIDAHAPGMVFQACGGSMAVRRELFDALGGFDEAYPAAWEDTEICWRAWLRGWGCLHVPDAVCRHAVGAASSTREGGEVRLRGTFQGRLRFATSHLPIEYCLATWTASAAGTAVAVLTGRVPQAWTRARLMADVLTDVPGLLRRRRQAYRSANTTPRAHLRALLDLGTTRCL